MKTQREVLTVGFVSLVENIPLEILLLLHGGVKFRVVVLEDKKEKETHTVSCQRAGNRETTLCRLLGQNTFFFPVELVE